MAVTTSRFAAVLGLCASVLGLAACDLKLTQTDDSAAQAGAGGESSLEGKTPEEVLASAACMAPAPGRAPLRRMSNAEYRNTMTDLLGDSPETASLVAAATRSFPSETESLGFRNNADYLGVSTLVAQGYVDAAE